jgi:hypothetical protein
MIAHATWCLLCAGIVGAVVMAANVAARLPALSLFGGL